MDVERLKTITAFRDLPEEDLRKIALLASDLSVSEGKDLVREGDFSAEILGIVQGTADVTHDGECVAKLKAGDIIGEMGVMAKMKRGATVTATSPMMLIVLDSLDIKRLRTTAPEAIERIYGIVEDRQTDNAG